jgi:Pup amidohydrolase
MKKKKEETAVERPKAPRSRVPKVCGSDIELANFLLGTHEAIQTDILASRLLLREIRGWPQKNWNYTGGYASSMTQAPGRTTTTSYAGYGNYAYPASQTSGYSQTGTYGSNPAPGYDPQDWGRRFLDTNGGCVYIDLNHLEICTPELVSAYDYVAASRAMLEVARQAREAASAKLPAGLRLVVLANNVDGHGHTFGSHCNFLITRAARSNIFDRKLQFLLYLAAFQVSSIIYTGQGKVGSDNGQTPCNYQISQRADYFEVLTGVQTTYNRPIVNSRNESLCGLSGTSMGTPRPGGDLQRVHCIFYDHSLCQVATLLRMGVMQIVLAMIEAEHMNPGLLLDDPLAALWQWSHDPSLTATARNAAGKNITAAEHQLLFCEEAGRFIEQGGCDDIVPRAKEIHALWADTLQLLHAKDFGRLAPRIDWILKKEILETAMQEHPDLNWQSPAIKKLDLVYSDIDLSEGIFWEYEKIGATECVVTPDEIAHFVSNPPSDTRAWTRAMMLRLGKAQVDDVDWDELRFKVKEDDRSWPVTRVLETPDPLEHDSRQAEPILRDAHDLVPVLDALGATRPSVTQYNSTTSQCTCPSCTSKRARAASQAEFGTAGNLPATVSEGGAVLEAELDDTP